MAGTVYFGNATTQMWIKAPQSGMEASSTGYNSKLEFLNGGSSVRRSKQSHREFAMSWNSHMNGSSQETGSYAVKDFFDGLYGDGPFYWNDPFATTSNILPPNWAAPMLSEKDWSNLSATIVPEFVAQVYANGYPAKYAKYEVAGSTTDTKKLTIIIPEGYVFHFGWHSTSAGLDAASGPGVKLIPYDRDGVVGTALTPDSLLAGGTTRTNTTVDGDDYSRVEICIANGSTTADLDLVAMVGQVLRAGESPATGGFISGRGTNALEFTDTPKVNYITSAIGDGLIEMSANFTEVL